MTDNTPSPEAIAAFALAVHVRNVVMIEPPDVDPGDHFPVEDWQIRYDVALEYAIGWSETYPDPEERVHNIQGQLYALGPLGS